MNRDIRMLVLYKQHYQDQYNQPLTACQYSCWGYYDGMSVKKVEPVESRLFQKKSASPISELWYYTMENAGDLSGAYGEQNIGLFRCVSQEDDILCRRFWDEHEKMPYFAIAFLQLHEKGDYNRVREELEQIYQKESGPVIYRLLAYCSFDNADLVVLVQGNSVDNIERIFREIEQKDTVAYLHPVMGVSENYLKEKIPESWNGIDCHGNEEIAEIRISVVTSGALEIIHWIKKQLSEYFSNKVDEISFSHASGHENLVIRIQNTEVNMLLRMLMENEFATHQNVLYENGIYNIETSVYMEKNLFSEINGYDLPKKRKPGPDGWCKRMIGKYQKDFTSWMSEGNESMYSYYQALLHTLNTLGQYEKFQLADSMFYQLYPSFQMFLQQFDIAVDRMKENGKSEKAMETIKDSLCKYLESVNSVMYHTTHTDQIFLMIPGYSGTTFSIPSKLSLLYCWLCGKIINILNDSGRYKYQCLLTPVMESKPGTDLISFGLGHGDRLIRVKLSQRSLYMPRDLMIILTHEVAHYVGDQVRHRKFRLSEIIRVLAVLITEGILPKDYNGDRQIKEDFALSNRKEMQRYIVSALEKRMEATCRASGYHASDIDEELKIGCREVLANEGCALQNIIYKVPEQVLERMDNNPADRIRYIRSLQRLQESCDRNRKSLLMSGEMDKIISELIRSSREVFSDVAALAILEFDLQGFQEASDVSEGVVDEEKSDERQSARQAVIWSILSKKPGNQEHDSASQRKNQNQSIDKPKSLYYNLYAYDCTKELLERYAEKCYEELKKRVQEKDKEVQSVREIFHMFTGKSKATCSEIFEKIYARIDEYIGKVSERIS